MADTFRQLRRVAGVGTLGRGRVSLGVWGLLVLAVMGKVAGPTPRVLFTLTGRHHQSAGKKGSGSEGHKEAQEL